jgi:hypothetical protein
VPQASLQALNAGAEQERASRAALERRADDLEAQLAQQQRELALLRGASAAQAGRLLAQQEQAGACRSAEAASSACGFQVFGARSMR